MRTRIFPCDVAALRGSGQAAVRVADKYDVIVGIVHPGIVRAHQQRQGFPPSAPPVVDERAQRVEAVAFLVPRDGGLLFGVDVHQRGLHVDDQRVVFPGHRGGRLFHFFVGKVDNEPPTPWTRFSA